MATLVDVALTHGERGGDGKPHFNVLERHEQLLRALSASARSREPSPQLAVLLHGSVQLLLRDSLLAAAADVAPPSTGAAAALARRDWLPARPVLRLEPAELLATGETRAHWHDREGGRHAQTARWSADGRVLRLLLVDGAPRAAAAPLSHRGWLEAVLSADEPTVRRWLAADVQLRHEGGEARGVQAVAAELRAWADALRHSRRLELSRVTHPSLTRTRAHVFVEPFAGDGCGRPAAEARLVQVTLRWGVEGGGEVIVQIVRRTLTLKPHALAAVPFDLWAAAAAAGGGGVLHAPEEEGYESDEAPAGGRAGGRARGRGGRARGAARGAAAPRGEVYELLLPRVDKRALASFRAAQAADAEEHEGRPLRREGRGGREAGEGVGGGDEGRLVAAEDHGKEEEVAGSERVKAEAGEGRAEDSCDEEGDVGEGVWDEEDWKEEAAAAGVVKAEADLKSDAAAVEAAMKYEGRVLLTTGPHAGTQFSVLDAHAALMRLQGQASASTLASLAAMLEDDVEYSLHASHLSAPAELSICGKAQVLQHLKREELPRCANRLVGVQPIELLLHSRTSARFGRAPPKPMPVERVRDVIEWGGSGGVRRWRRVVDPPLAQHDWLRCLSRGRTAELGRLLAEQVVFMMLDVAPPSVLHGKAAVLEAVEAMGVRMDGRVHFVGRTRELDRFEWPLPAALLSKLAQEKSPTAKRAARHAEPSISQAILVGDWTPRGAKWYSDKRITLRETAEWREEMSQPKIALLVWERLPHDHPQTKPVWAELLRKERRMKAEAQQARAKVPAAPARPAWSEAAAKPTVRSRKGLIAAMPGQEK
ncbi:hypothetical protein AB1Y20_023266 [Prymnesium parvum]|uniref:Uncharacterized protein n=1 Tax=Prymnesium parvum TaxID=97485 RepID=A0AB34JFQ3_PRYPA